MVIRDQEHEDFYLKIDGKWIFVNEEIMRKHPGGGAIATYRNRDATTVFHSFHAGSKAAYKMLQEVRSEQRDVKPTFQVIKEDPIVGIDDVNIGQYNMTDAQAQEVSKKFDLLRFEVRRRGMLDGDTPFFMQKFAEAVLIICTAILLQYYEFYIVSALCMGLAWQQLGWMIHEYCHHQHFKSRFLNDVMSYIVGNLMQGFSSGGWKEQHNVHHAATNVIGRDGDLDLMPFWATVASDLKLLDGASWFLQLIPYQHLYWTLMLPFLRLSWLLQSIIFVSKMDNHFYDIHRRRARAEQVTLAIHWILVFVQLAYLPDMQTRLYYFLVSQLFGGFLLAHVVTYNHYSMDKFPHNTKILDNYPCLQLYTTRNMRPGPFVDWLWGGLNYQIEHHLFPTMPRNKLTEAMPLVKQFCKENNLPYMVDDYLTGWKYEIIQFRNVANVAAKLLRKAA
ncbi:FAT-4 protein [Aphelenchoides avenae]|nr:FAT-4 protein [Aphelenchus avenae]